MKTAYSVKGLMSFIAILVAFISFVLADQSISVNNSLHQKNNKTLLPAFPGAEGFGAESIGGRGGKIIEVTNLNDSGPGSLRFALKEKGPRIVIFKIAGIINLTDAIRINEVNSFLTVAGQTAPGGGIVIKGTDNNIFVIQKGAHDIIIRYLRLRNGSGIANGSGHDNLTISGAHNVIIDHVSTSWSTDENISMYRKKDNPDIYNITIQRSIASEGLAGHSNGMIVSGTANYRNPENPQEEWRRIYNVSVHHNLFIHNTHRNPRITAGGIQIINNVVYNWKYRVGASTRGSVYDNINNYWKPGPMTNINNIFMHENFSPERLLEKYPDPSIYTSGNVVENIHDDPNEDDWNLYKINFIYIDVPKRYRRFTPLPDAPIPVQIQSAHEAYISVLQDVGASARVDCNGEWIKNYDAIDISLLADVHLKTGPLNAYESAQAGGGYIDVDPGVFCPDSDHDGMPDEWEIKNGFNPKKASDGNEDADGDGYTNVEEYLNGIHD
jgi:pectate lyase